MTTVDDADEWDEFFGPPVKKRKDGQPVPQLWKDDIGKNIGAIQSRARAAPPNISSAMVQPTTLVSVTPTPAAPTAGGGQQQQGSSNPLGSQQSAEPIAAPQPTQRPAQTNPPPPGGAPPPQQQQVVTMYAGVILGQGQPPVPYIAPFPVQVGQSVQVENAPPGAPLGVVAFVTDQPPPQPTTLKLVPPTVYAGVKLPDGNVVPHLAPFPVQQGQHVQVDGGAVGVVTFITTQPPPQPCTVKIISVVGPSPHDGGGGPAPATQAPSAPPQQQPPPQQQYPPVAVISFSDGTSSNYFAPFRIDVGNSVFVEGREDAGTVSTFLLNWQPSPGQPLPVSVKCLAPIGSGAQRRPSAGNSLPPPTEPVDEDEAVDADE